MKEILNNLDIDTIIPHGGGIESAAAVAWAKRLGLKPLLLSLDMGDVPKIRHTIEAVKKQAKHFNVPLHIERNTIPMIQYALFTITSNLCLGKQFLLLN